MAFISAFSPIYRRRVAKFVSETVQKRFMAGIGGPTIPPPGGYTGIDKIVRTYLPEDYQGRWCCIWGKGRKTLFALVLLYLLNFSNVCGSFGASIVRATTTKLPQCSFLSFGTHTNKQPKLSQFRLPFSAFTLL